MASLFLSQKKKTDCNDNKDGGNHRKREGEKGTLSMNSRMNRRANCVWEGVKKKIDKMSEGHG